MYDPADISDMDCVWQAVRDHGEAEELFLLLLALPLGWGADDAPSTGGVGFVVIGGHKHQQVYAFPRPVVLFPRVYP